MIWLVQNALFGTEDGHAEFCAAIDAAGERRISIDYTFWDYTLDMKLGDISPADILPFGTRDFVCYGRKNGWRISWDEDFSYSSLLALGEDFINHDMQVAPLGSLPIPETGKFFVREAAGFNIIKGRVLEAYEWPATYEAFLDADGAIRREHDYHEITDDTLFAIAPVKQILNEYRVWIIDGKPVTSSEYITRGDIEYRNTDDDAELHAYAQQIADRNPIRTPNYVLDVFRTPDGLRVGEINCMHCSGWYAINPQKVVEHLGEQMK